MQGLDLSASTLEGKAPLGDSIASFSGRLSANLQKSERLLSDLRSLATREDDGNIKFLAPLGKIPFAFHSISRGNISFAARLV